MPCFFYSVNTGSSSDDIIQDKFLVQTYTFDSKNSVPDENRLSSFWKGLPHGAIKEHRLFNFPCKSVVKYYLGGGGGEGSFHFESQ